ncbi:unnamed protein product, partial [Adineta ricciae]
VPSSGVEQLNVIVTGDFRDTIVSPQSDSSDSSRSQSRDLIKELHLIDTILTTLDQLVRERTIHLLQTSSPLTSDELLILYKQHQAMEEFSLSSPLYYLSEQMSRQQEIKKKKIAYPTTDVRELNSKHKGKLRKGNLVISLRLTVALVVTQQIIITAVCGNHMHPIAIIVGID